MKLLCISIISLLLFSNSLPLAGSDVSSAPNSIYEINAKWTDTKFVIVAVKRLDLANVLMVIQIAAGAKADIPTYIGYLNKDDGSLPANQGVAPNPNLHKRDKYRAFSLLDATVVDEGDKIQFGAVPQTPGTPSFGPSIITTTMFPGNWLQLSVQFHLPVPPPNPDGTVPIQKVDVTLPQAKNTIKSVVVPPLGKI